MVELVWTFSASLIRAAICSDRAGTPSRRVDELTISEGLAGLLVRAPVVFP